MMIGHQKQWQILTKLAETGNLPHALLFSGPANIGKKTLALELAKLLLGRAEGHPDFHLVVPSQKGIQIGQIRELGSKLVLRPYSAALSFVIIDSCHLMNQEAQSAFLKLLEEPKSPTLFILISEYQGIILPTILSRTTKVKFYPVSSRTIKERLRSQGVSEELAQDIVRFSMGRPGLAMEFLQNPLKLKMQKEKIKDLERLLKSDLAQKFHYAKNMSERNPREVLEIWLGYLRERLVSGNFSEKLTKNIKLMQTINFLLTTTNINPRLSLEVVMIELSFGRP